MSATAYALYPDLDTALRALVDLRRAGVPEDRINLVDGERSLDETAIRELPTTDRRRGSGWGVVLGGVAGGLIGLLAGLLGAVTLHPLLAVVLGLAGGAFFGMLGGLLFGSGQAQSEIARAAGSLDEGEALLAVDVEPGRTPSRDRVDEILAAHGGTRLAHRQPPMTAR